MTWSEIAIAVGGVICVVLLVRAIAVINRSPYTRLKGLEDMGVRFPPNLPFWRRHRLLDWRGLAPPSIARTLALVGAVVAFVILFVLLHRT